MGISQAVREGSRIPVPVILQHVGITHSGGKILYLGFLGYSGNCACCWEREMKMTDAQWAMERWGEGLHVYHGHFQASPSCIKKSTV